MTTDPRPILVTGATGNVGREVVRILEASGTPYRAASRTMDRAPRARGVVGEEYYLDLARPDTFDDAVRGARGMFLVRPPAIADVGPTINALVDRAVAAGVEHVVFLSVEGADRQRWVPHHAIEQHLRRSPVVWTFLRAGFFAQNFGDAYRRDIETAGEILLPAGQGRVAFVDVRDIAELAARAFDEPAWRGRAWTLTGPEAVTFTEAAKIMSDALGRSIVYREAGILRYVQHLRRQGLPWGHALVQTVLHVGLRFGHAATVDPALGLLLGRSPRRLADYVRDHTWLWRVHATSCPAEVGRPTSGHRR